MNFIKWLKNLIKKIFKQENLQDWWTYKYLPKHKD